MVLAHLTRLHWDRGEGLTDQEAGPFVEADDRVGGVIRQRIERQNLLHAGETERVQGAKAPHRGQMRLQFVCFRISATEVCEMVSQKPASTAFSASRRTVQRSWPVGAALHARAVIWARCVPSIAMGRPERGASWRQAKPAAWYVSRHAAPVTKVTSRVAATSVRVLPRSSSSSAVARLKGRAGREPLASSAARWSRSAAVSVTCCFFIPALYPKSRKNAKELRC